MPVPYPGQMMGAVPNPGPSQYPPSFSYGLPQGYGQQQGAVSWGASAIGNIPGAVQGVGVAAGIGAMFTSNAAVHAAQYLDPTNLGFATGGRAMMGMLPQTAAAQGWAAKTTAAWAERALLPEALEAGAIGMAGPMAIGMAAYGGAKYVGGQFMSGAREQNMLGQQLGGLTFTNGMAATGRGFNFAQMNQIGQTQRRMDASDAFTSMSDISQMTDQFMGAGMHRGIESAREFSKKLKEFVSNVKDVAMELGTTLEEAGRIKLAMRQTGFYSAADVMGNTRQMQVAKGQGMDEGTYLGMQSQAAQMSRDMGLTGRAGGKTSARLAQQIMMNSATGRGMSDEQLMDATGAGSGQEAAAAMSLQMTGALTRYLKGAAGNAFLAGAGVQEDGSFTGEVDATKLRGVKLTQLASLGRGRLNSAQSRASFKTHQDEMLSSLLGSESGVDAVMSSINQTMDEHFGGAVQSDDARKLAYEKLLGVDERVAQNLLDTFKNSIQNKTELLKKQRQQENARLLEIDQLQNYTLGGISQQVTGGFHDVFGSKFGVLGADFATATQQAGQSVVDKVMGVSRGQASQATIRASLSRMAAGTAQVSSTATSVEDFGYGSVGRAMASRSGVQAAQRMKQDALSGEFTLDSLGFSDDSAEGKEMAAFLRTQEGAKAQKMIRAARLEEDPANAQAMRNVAGAFMAKGLGSIAGQSGKAGFAEKYNRSLSALMLKSGDTEGARERAFGGATQSHTYGDVTKARETAAGQLMSVGIGETLAKSMAGGGAGSELFSALNRADKDGSVKTGGSLNYFNKLLAAHPELNGLSGDELHQKLADIASADKDLGGITVTAEDVSTVLQANKDIGRYQVFFRTPEQTLQKRMSVAGAAATTALDTSISGVAASDAAARLGRMDAKAKAALGSGLTTAISSLKDPTKGAQAVTDLGLLLKRADEAGVVTGNEEFDAAVTARRAEAALASKGSRAQIEKDYGLTAGSTGKEDLMAVVNREAAKQVLASSGSAGGSFLRGQSQEQQMAQYLGATAASVTEMQKNSIALAHVIKEIQDQTPSGVINRVTNAVAGKPAEGG